MCGVRACARCMTRDPKFCRRCDKSALARARRLPYTESAFSCSGFIFHAPYLSFCPGSPSVFAVRAAISFIGNVVIYRSTWSFLIYGYNNLLICCNFRASFEQVLVQDAKGCIMEGENSRAVRQLPTGKLNYAASCQHRAGKFKPPAIFTGNGKTYICRPMLLFSVSFAVQEKFVWISSFSPRRAVVI